MRTDKDPADCVRQAMQSAEGDPETETEPAKDAEQPPASAASVPAPAPAAVPAKSAKAAADRTVVISNPKKVFWPAEGYTKGNLIEYYQAISPWLLPYLRNRPVVMTRFPDGTDGKSFYQKDAPDFTPDWLRTHPIWSEDTQRDIRYFVADDI